MSFLDEPDDAGAAPGGKVYEVHIRLRGIAAVRARVRAWHRSQQLKELPGGDVEITLWLRSLTEVKYDILKCGPNAEALSPPELRASVGDFIAKALKQYET